MIGLEGEAFAGFRTRRQAARTRSRRAKRRRVTLGERGYEIFSFVPIERDFAAIGLGNMLNSHGAVRAVSWPDERTVTVTLADGGVFVAYSAKRPASVEVSGATVGFEYDAKTGALRVALPLRGRLDVTVHL